ncbi:hypothetical protein OJAV_G00232870 [Oryzias javanicus]|uniref:Chemokine interleukin-8-like domain-containing protein n=1 Tax=Oryzias javanicus TaxID=123683 RepID=A0A437C054_ORYJA|nr:hypothetical protein OJAV_G00232870 [Oryzias javanicus]
MTQMMMKVSVAMVTFFLLFSFDAVPASAEVSLCCTSFYPRRIPDNKVKSFKSTSTLCHKRGVIITTTNNRNICLDPSEEWVKKLVKVLPVRHLSTLTQNS